MSILDDIENDAPPRPNRWLEKLKAKDPEFAGKVIELIVGWHAGTRAQNKKSKNSLAKYIRDYDDNRVGVTTQAIVDVIDELKPEAK